MSTDKTVDSQNNQNETSPTKTPKSKGSLWWRIIKGGFWTGVIGTFIGVIVLAIAVAMAWPTLPSVDALKDYKPRMAMQIFTEDGQLIGEFGEERRKMIAIKDVPEHVKWAILSIEDARFYDHDGIDYKGLGRAIINNVLHPNDPQGASTITQQLAKNFFLSSERTFNRKFYEALMAKKIEQNLSKDEILERYINHIFLGERAYGFPAAAEIYFGKELKDVSIAEAAMLAALPQAPGRNNPIRNRANADSRQQYILERMRDIGKINQAQFDEAKKETVRIVDTRSAAINRQYSVHAEYVAEMARQLMFERYKDAAYTEGLKVYTTINSAEQTAAYEGVRKAVLNYDTKYGYRGAEAQYELPAKAAEQLTALDKIFDDPKHKDFDNLRAAVVLSASGTSVKAVLADGEEISITGSGLNFAKKAMGSGKSPIKTGSVIRVIENIDDASWRISQVPEVQASFISMSSTDGAVRALVGGFDFNQSKFNRVTDGYRQPGSGIKPFIYSAAMEKNGLNTGSIVDDTPIQIGSWRPQNSDGRYLGPVPLSTALASSRNMVSIRLLQSIGNDYFRQYATRFGFEPKRIDQYLTVALGAMETTSWQLAGAYGVFANGGYKVNPYIITKVIDRNGATILQAQPKKSGDPTNRVITEKNAAMTDALMRGVVRSGTGRAASALGRSDIGGKTGTTNDSKDAWFNGYQPKLVGIAWMGFDKPKSLGAGEFGGTLALPIWMNYMRVALNKQKVEVSKEVVEDTPVTTEPAAPVDPNAAPEELKVDSKAVPPSNSEARKAAEKTNEADVKEAAKPQPAPEAPVLPAAPVTPKEPVVPKPAPAAGG
ncbi:penicillin-binding protein 1A [Formosimonas limnophila]|uniref:Penicillin-binding protein 1A n=1 Tax=Formosimonas limnophila TaxID=1384487 RepID=A0A8J3FY88_9BURK|nr:PBP1A family penicillin-binding protein [Formosimonas limnophila]GHA71084.1 penicillin-binding protein 1A [Formosimonas limnophila]